MSERDSEKHVFTYMDGIPVKISEKYKPPRKIVLPVGFQNRFLQPPVSAEYDFQLEHDVLDKLHQWRSLRSEEKEKRRQRIREEDAEHQKMQEAIQEVEETMSELSTEVKLPLEKKPSLSPLPEQSLNSTQLSVKAQPLVPAQPLVCPPVISEVNPILRPVPIKHVVSSQINNNKPLSAFNLSDFEADTSSPFDNVELKTINDLEELAQVLQPAAITEVPSIYQSTIQSDDCFRNSHHAIMDSNRISHIEESFNPVGSGKMLNDAKSGVNYQPHINGFNMNYNYSGVQSYHPPSVIHHLNPHSQAAAYSFVEREHISHPHEVTFSYQHPDTQSQFQSYYNSSVWPPPGESKIATYEPTACHTAVINSGNIATPASTVPAMESQYSSSTLNKPLEESQDKDDKPSINCVAQQLSTLMQSRSSKFTSKQESPPCNDLAVKSCTFPPEEDPFLSLDLDSQRLVQKIAEMGFPRPRVARACHSLGCNDKKIIEFLLSLQSLLDAGFREERAEHALSLHNNDVDAAAKFLQAELQLLDLGFSRDRVSEALMKFKCDRDQALEFLIS